MSIQRPKQLSSMFTNKNSSDMKKKIYDIVFAAQYEGLSTKEATDQLLVLFGVVGRSEQFICHSCNTKHSGNNDNQLHEVCKQCFNSI